MSTTEAANTHRNLRTQYGDKCHLGIASTGLGAREDALAGADRTLCGCAVTYRLTASPATTFEDAVAQTTCKPCQQVAANIAARRAAPKSRG
jgi:hypothetical protein